MNKTTFVPVSKAKEIILKAVKSGDVVHEKLERAYGCVLAGIVRGSTDSPPFHQSAMDGYAFRFADLANSTTLQVSGESAAGKNYIGKVKPGQAVRIFTGAAVPDGADTVVMQEKTGLVRQQVTILDEQVRKGMNIRLKGSHFSKGNIAAGKGVVLHEGTIGYLAALGVEKVNVYRKPSVTLIITGEELVKPGKNLKPGQIYESNAATLQAALKRDHIPEAKVIYVKDDLNATRKAFLKAVKQSDFVLFTGGISAGDYDHVGTVMKLEKVKTGFYKVQQKPGKPLYFGVRNNRYIFGLPGNPASVLTCYYEYARPALKKFMGFNQPLPVQLNLPVTEEIKKKPGLTHFLKAVTDFHTVTPLPGQESYIMTPFVKANCFIVLPADVTFVEKDSRVTIHLF